MNGGLRKFSPDPDLAEQCLVHGQLKQRAMGFCWDTAMSINVLYGACKLSLFLQRLSRLDLKEEKSYKRPSSSLLFSVSFHVQCLSLLGSSLTHSFCLSLQLFYSHIFRSYLVHLYIIADRIKHHLCLSSSACFPHLTLHFSLGLYWLDS